MISVVSYPFRLLSVTMNRYNVVKVLGDGTYGSVILCTNSETGEKVAVKKLVIVVFTKW